MVSKKSLNMIAKIVRAAVIRPSLSKALVRSKLPSVEKEGVTVRPFGGSWVTPATRATIVVTKMLMISAARILSTYSEMVISRPRRKTN